MSGMKVLMENFKLLLKKKEKRMRGIIGSSYQKLPYIIVQMLLAQRVRNLSAMQETQEIRV